MTDFGKKSLISSGHGDIYVCSISFNTIDRLRLIAMPEEMIEYIRGAILKGWGQETIQAEGAYFGAHQFKLQGSPWKGHGEDAVKSRRLLTYILKAMALKGWNLLQSADVSKKQGDKDTLFFEYGKPDPEAHLFAMSLNMSNTIRLIGAPNECIPCVKEAVESQWPSGMNGETKYHGSLALHLTGSPWCPEKAEKIQVKMLLSQIIVNMRDVGYKLYGSIDISAGDPNLYQGGMDLDSWIFRKITPFWQ